MQNSDSSIVIYQTADGQTELSVRLEGDTVWLSQAQMAVLFERDRTVIGKHINNIYKEGELKQNTTCANFAHMGVEGDQIYETKLFTKPLVEKTCTQVLRKRQPICSI